MRASVWTATLVGVDAVPVEVQADVGRGLPSFTLVGLGDAAVLEARDRVRSALRAAGYEFPAVRVVVNLAPAPLRKRGTGFDLPIAISLLAATGQLRDDALDVIAHASLVGELSLDGAVRPVQGLLAHSLAARRRGRRLIGPADASEAPRLLQGDGYLPISHLRELRSPTRARHDPPAVPVRPTRLPGRDLAHVRGHAVARRVLEIAAAGGHNLLLSGPPGSGKTMLASRLPSILPEMDDEERVQSAVIHSVAGLDDAPSMAGVRPFRAPHHSCSTAGLVGGGSPPRPGEACLAHMGVLFLDEMNQFAPSALQALRQPLEDGVLTLVRADGAVTFPASFTLVGAVNPCPCGFFGDPEKPCRCTPANIRRHSSRIGGPLMDRLDLCVRVDRVDPALILRPDAPTECSRVVAERVRHARAFAAGREGPPLRVSSGPALLRACSLPSADRAFLADAARTHGLSGRGITRLLRVARTIADLASEKRVRRDHLVEALAYRSWETPR